MITAFEFFRVCSCESLLSPYWVPIESLLNPSLLPFPGDALSQQRKHRFNLIDLNESFTAAEMRLKQDNQYFSYRLVSHLKRLLSLWFFRCDSWFTRWDTLVISHRHITSKRDISCMEDLAFHLLRWEEQPSSFSCVCAWHRLICCVMQMFLTPRKTSSSTLFQLSLPTVD
jgi:hypothetical protein